MTRYVPILKGRQGEFNALADIQPATRNGLLPLVEVVPGDPTDPRSVVAACERTVDRLARSWGSATVLLDGGLLDLSLDPHGRARGPLWELAELARAAGLRAVPVLRLHDDVLARTDVAAACALDGHGLCVRLVEEDLDEEPEDLDRALDDLIHDVGVPRTGIDLVLDAGAVDGDAAVRRQSRIIGSLLRGLVQVEGWRSITVAGGAFPEGLPGFRPWVIGRRPRFDAVLFDQVVGRRLPREPDFGDYAVAHPLLRTGMPFAPSPQLRYAVAGEWLVLKGRRNDPRGNAQFFDICDEISRQPEFSGRALGVADQRIFESRQGGPADSATWRQIGITHHLDLVVSRLTTLGEP